MTSTSARPSFHEPLRQTLARNLAIAVVVGAVLALLERRLALWLPISVLALWFSLGGHYVELLFLNQVRPRIRAEGVARLAWRIGLWFCGGAVLYTCMAVTARGLPLLPPRGAIQLIPLPFGLWWVGGLSLIGIELVVHAVLAVRRLPNFYRGTG